MKNAHFRSFGFACQHYITLIKKNIICYERKQRKKITSKQIFSGIIGFCDRFSVFIVKVFSFSFFFMKETTFLRFSFAFTSVLPSSSSFSESCFSFSSLGIIVSLVFSPKVKERFSASLINFLFSDIFFTFTK